MRCKIPFLHDKPFRHTRKASRLARSLRRILKKNGGGWKLEWSHDTNPEHLETIQASEPTPDRLIRGYGLRLHPGTHLEIQLVPIGDFDIARYSFRSSQAPQMGQILLLHGYVIHSLCQSSFISHLVSKGWEVIAIDWPGHGLSSGKRANIADFSIYAQILSAVIDTTDRNSGNAPLHLIAHSTGCSAWIERMINDHHDPFNKVILISPLLRNAAWRASVTGVWVAMKMGWSLVPRVFRNSSHDSDYLKLVRQDPLAPWILPIQWSRSLIRWQKMLHQTPPFERPVTVFQGTNDTVVDWKYGLSTIRRIFPRVSIIRCKGQRHDLLNESLSVRTEIFEAIDRILCPPIDPNSDSPSA